jgi:hypothetical protein
MATSGQLNVGHHANAASQVASPKEPLGQSDPIEAASGASEPAPIAQPPSKVNAKQPSAILFKNVKVFDGKSDKVTASTSVLVVGNKIEKIGGNIAAPGKSDRHRRPRAHAYAGPDRRPLAHDVRAADAR